MQKDDLLGGLLRDVSRSFYLTLRVLPRPIRSQIGLAYLLARTSDTIADTELISVAERLETLRAFRSRVLGQTKKAIAFKATPFGRSSSAETLLLERVEESLRLLESFSPEDQQLIAGVLDTIIGGQELDLERFSHGSAKDIIALRDSEELDDYTYRVAGCVGEFWTKICWAHLFPPPATTGDMLKKGMELGKGLQLVNILRDLPRDLRAGRCYLPAEDLAGVGLRPKDLLDPTQFTTVQTVFRRYTQIAWRYLQNGWSYTNSIPFSQKRVRLACAWPVLIGARTLQRLESKNPLQPEPRIKVSRSEVWGIVLRSILIYPVPFWWKRQLAAAAGHECS